MEIIKKFTIMPRESITIDCRDYVKAKPDAERLYIDPLSIHLKKLKVTTDHIDGVKMYYVKNAADSPVFIELVRIS
jgi:hypothetical protein